VSHVPESIHRFNLLALAAFGRLYSEFPQPLALNTTELAESVTPSSATNEEKWAFLFAADAAISWLQEEGFIRYSERGANSAYLECRLTLKGLTVLGYLPTSVKGAASGQPIIEKVKKTLASGVEKAGAEGVKTLIAEVFKLATGLG
jgi:hypothetical protein